MGAKYGDFSESEKTEKSVHNNDEAKHYKGKKSQATEQHLEEKSVHNNDEAKHYKGKKSQATEQHLEDAEFCDKTDHECDIYRGKIISNWIYLKNELNPISILERYCADGRLKEDDFPGFRQLRRSHQAELLLIYILPKIVTLEDIEYFENTLQSLSTFSLREDDDQKQIQDSIDSDSDQKEWRTISEQRRSSITRLLRSEDVVMIKDWLFQYKVIDFNTNKEMVCKWMIYDKKRKDVNDKILDVVSTNIRTGSFECLKQCLTKLADSPENVGKRHRLTQLLDILKQPEIKSTKQEKKPNLPESKLMYRKYSCGDISQSVPLNDIQMTVSMKNDDVEKDKIKQVYQSFDQKSITSVAMTEFGRECVDINEGSVIIDIRSYDASLDFLIVESIKHGDFMVFLEKMLAEVKAETILDPGKYRLEVKVQTFPSTKANTKAKVPCGDHMRCFEDNRSFFIEEMQTDLILDGFKENGIETSVFDLEEKKIARTELATNIIDKVIGDDKLKEIFEKILIDKNLGCMLHRLKTYEENWKGDVSRIRANIVRTFRSLVKEIDFHDIWNTLAARNIYEDKVYNHIMEMSGENRHLQMAYLLGTILGSTDRAVFSFLDALYVNDLDTIAEQLTSIHVKDAYPFHGKTDSTCVDVDTECLLLHCTYDLVIQRNEETAIGNEQISMDIEFSSGTSLNNCLNDNEKNHLSKESSFNAPFEIQESTEDFAQLQHETDNSFDVLDLYKQSIHTNVFYDSDQNEETDLVFVNRSVDFGSTEKLINDPPLYRLSIRKEAAYEEQKEVKRGKTPKKLKKPTKGKTDRLRRDISKSTSSLTGKVLYETKKALSKIKSVSDTALHHH